MADPIISVKNASVRFNLAKHTQKSIPNYVRQLFQRELLFQEFFALKDINLEVMPGESWGFVGRNGSGKSTLLKLIAGILKPYPAPSSSSGATLPRTDTLPV